MPTTAEQLCLDELGIPLREVTFVVVDLETTGGAPATDAITATGRHGVPWPRPTVLCTGYPGGLSTTIGARPSRRTQEVRRDHRDRAGPCCC